MRWIENLKEAVKDVPLTIGTVEEGSIDREGKYCVAYPVYTSILTNINQTQKACEGTLKLKQEITSAYLSMLQTLIQKEVYREFLENVLSDENTKQELEMYLHKVEQELKDMNVVVGDIFVEAMVQRKENLESYGITLLKF